MSSAGTFMHTKFEWLAALESMSSLIAGLGLKSVLQDEVYKIAGKKSAPNKDAFNFANSAEHNRVIVDTLDALAEQGVKNEIIRKLVVDLLSKNIYGAFCEFAAYNMLLAGGHSFDIQVPVSGNDILNPNGSDLDGLLRLGNEEAYFDAKAFGFTEHLRGLLIERLQEQLDPDFLAVSGNVDVSVGVLQHLLGKDFTNLLAEIKANKTAKRDTITFSLRPPARVQVVHQTINNDQLTEQNKDYVFRFAKQFVRNKPFFLFFIIHPWVSTLRLTNNFAGNVDEIMSSFASKTFTQSRADQTSTFNVTRGVASDLLSGIIFIHAYWGPEKPEDPLFRVFLNPHATNPLSEEAIDILAKPYGEKMRITRF